MTPSRRTLLGGLLATLAAPAIIRTPGLLMPVRVVHCQDDLLLADAVKHFQAVRKIWDQAQNDIPTSVISSADWNRVCSNLRLDAERRAMSGRAGQVMPNTRFRFIVSDGPNA